MEEPRQVPDLVHVLRHTFRPSEQLEPVLENFLPPESKRPPSFPQIKSLGAFGLDAYLHSNHAYTLRLIEARKEIDKNKGHSLEVIPNIEIREVNEHSIDILMGVRNNEAMNALRLGTKALLKSDAILLRDRAASEFSVYARINSSVPISDAFQKQAIKRFYESYEQFGSKHLMSILPEGITGMDQHVRLRKADLYDSY